MTGVLEDHYANFITEEDIAEIAGAGLNWIRLPIPFWAIETWADVGGGVGEPFLAKVCWKYILRIFKWARKYGIRINLYLHTIPGSQNGGFIVLGGGFHRSPSFECSLQPLWKIRTSEFPQWTDGDRQRTTGFGLYQDLYRVYLSGGFCHNLFNRLAHIL